MKEFYSLISTTEENNSHVNEEDVSQTSHGAKTSTGIYRKESIYKQYWSMKCETVSKKRKNSCNYFLTLKERVNLYKHTDTVILTVCLYTKCRLNSR